MKIVFATWRVLVGSRQQNRGLRRRGSDAAILSISFIFASTTSPFIPGIW